jgi:hypothetical protein
MNQALYAHMNNKRKMKKKNQKNPLSLSWFDTGSEFVTFWSGNRNIATI